MIDGGSSLPTDSYLKMATLIQEANDPMTIMQRVVDESLKLSAGADGAAVELLDPDGCTLRHVCCAGSLWNSLGLRLDLETSLSGKAVMSNSTLWCEDAESDPRVDRKASRQTGTASIICVPLVASEKPLGVLQITSTTPRAFTQTDMHILGGLAEFVAIAIRNATEMRRITSYLLNKPEDDSPKEAEAKAPMFDFMANVIDPAISRNLMIRRRISRIIETGDVSFAFQPIIDLEEGTLVAAEVFARFDGNPKSSPDLWFQDAHRTGLGMELELFTAAAALRELRNIPEGSTLAVNIGPEAILSDRLTELLKSIDTSRLIIELTEHLRVEDYTRLVKRFLQIRQLGVRLAIDDTGSGFSSFSHIIKLAPDIMKLDRELIRDIHKDPVRKSLTTAVVNFADETGTEVIAEGIETEDELATLKGLGIKYGQGFLLGKPGPLSMLHGLSLS